MTEAISQSFLRRCISDILNGLSNGLSHFSGASRAAVIFALTPESPMMLCDPQHLLKGHEPIFKHLFLDSQTWRSNHKIEASGKELLNILPLRNLGLAGLLSNGGYSSPVFYQHWFTEHHPDLCATGPTECWLEHAVWRFSHDIANGSELYSGISGYFLKEYATHAVRDHIIDLMNQLIGWDTPLRIYPVLDAILMISETREEGSWPEGRLLFVDPRMMRELNFLIQFEPEMRPKLIHYKHVRKMLLSVEQSERYLVSDGRSVLGICGGALPSFYVGAEFMRRRGLLSVNNTRICSFSDGRFSSTNYQPKLVQFEEVLLEYEMEQSQRFLLFQIVDQLVRHAQERKHGCTLVIDFNSQPRIISGHTLSPALDLRQDAMLQMAKSLAKVDGALHIGVDLHLHGFASLLDGRSFDGEDRARGARYNSALRFTHEHHKVIVVVVSSDQPVSVLHEGVDLEGVCTWGHSGAGTYNFDTLASWAA